ncbi:winged helix-turn-helix transcriptional regulator, partial [Candidatus Bathyarchaeota archaeon]|nr:winged helix-turn-helix transcriptional regulator [Candidatus Bathyarchaeota archaeon]
KVFLGILILCLLYPVGALGQVVTPESLSLRIYSDGSVDIEYSVEPDPTQAQVNVTLFGAGYQDIIVVDQDGIILDWTINAGGIGVDSLGSSSVIVSYSTDSLTNKTGSQWTVSITSPVDTIFTLPIGAVLVGLSPSPRGISIIDNQAFISMPAGTSRISYLIGTAGTREHAIALLNNAKADVNDVLEQGIIIDEAEAYLAQAITAYQNEQYIQSEQYSTHASASARETLSLAASALNKINAAKSIIDAKRSQISDDIIAQAEDFLDQAETNYVQGNYSAGLESAEEAYSLVSGAPINQSGNQTLLIAGGILVVLVAAGYWYMSQRDTEQILQKPDTQQPDIDLDEVFRKNPHLRTDDKAILRMLEETGGAFITEIRGRFDIPKSSAWRMARRLEDDGLISVSKVGRETYLQLKEQEEEQ